MILDDISEYPQFQVKNDVGQEESDWAVFMNAFQYHFRFETGSVCEQHPGYV